MRVIKCDACGTTYTRYDGDEKQKSSNGLLLVNFMKNGKYEKHGYFDLCPDCMRKLAAFLEGEDLAKEVVSVGTVFDRETYKPGIIQYSAGTIQYSDRTDPYENE